MAFKHFYEALEATYGPLRFGFAAAVLTETRCVGSMVLSAWLWVTVGVSYPQPVLSPAQTEGTLLIETGPCRRYISPHMPQIPTHIAPSPCPGLYSFL